MKVYNLLSVGKFFSHETTLRNKDKEHIDHPPTFLRFHCNNSVQLLPETHPSHRNHWFVFVIFTISSVLHGLGRSRFPSVIISFCLADFFYFLESSLLVMNSFIYSMSEQVFISLLFLKDTFSECRIWGDNFFLHYFEDVPLFSFACVISKKFVDILISAFVYDLPFIYVYFSYFFSNQCF